MAGVGKGGEGLKHTAPAIGVEDDIFEEPLVEDGEVGYTDGEEELAAGGEASCHGRLWRLGEKLGRNELRSWYKGEGNDGGMITSSD